MNNDIEAAERNWFAALYAPDAPLRVQGLACLGLAQLAVSRNSSPEALEHLQTADRLFSSAGDARGIAATLILKVRAFSATQDTPRAESAALAAKAYCQRHALADGVVESFLAVSDSDEASGDHPKAVRAFAHAETTALNSGLMPIRVLNRKELERLKQYIGGNLSVPKAREYVRWAENLGDLVLIEKSSQAMAAALKKSGQIAASGWYAVMAEDASASLAKLPASTRLLHGALIDYGLLNAGVDPGIRPELFSGTEYTTLCHELIAAIRRIEKLAPRDDDPEMVNEMVNELEVLAARVEHHRKSALGALRRGERKRAATEFIEFYQSVGPLLQTFGEMATQTASNTGQAPSVDYAQKVIYASLLLRAWAMHDPGMLRDIALDGNNVRMALEVPLLLAVRSSAGSGSERGLDIWKNESDTEALGAAIGRSRTPKGRSWARLVTRYAAAGGASAVTAAAFGVDPEKLNEQEAAQFQIAYAGQFALAANGEVPYVQLGGDESFAWLLSKMREDFDLLRDVHTTSQLGLTTRVLEMAYLSTERGAAQLAKTPYFQEVLQEDLDLPDFDSLSDDEDRGEKDEEREAEGRFAAPPKGFLRQFEFTAWGVQYPVLMQTTISPNSTELEQAMSVASANLTANASRMKASLPEVLEGLEEVQDTRRRIVLDLALSALAGKRYTEAIKRATIFEGMTSPASTLDRIQIKYIKAMCYRGLGNSRREEAMLSAAREELERLRLSVATRNASLRLRDLRQLMQEEYLSTLYRRGDWKGMARAIASYRQASTLPASVLAAAPRHPLARELETLKETYHALSTGGENSPISRQEYRELFKVFMEAERLPLGDPTLNAIERATYFVTNELYENIPPRERLPALIRPAAEGELLLLQSVGHMGVHTVTIDEYGRTSGYYRYVPIRSLEALCENFEKGIQAQGSTVQAGKQLYDKLLAYLPEMRDKRRVSILADGPIHNLAWPALPLSNGKFFIEAYEVGILSGVTPPHGRRGPAERGQILAIMTPEAGDAKGDELTAIGGRRSRSTVIPLVGMDASLSNIRRELNRADAVYISAHGQSDYLRPDYSFLELSGGARLYSLDLGGLDFSGRKLFLSACETRTGRAYGGEEAYGLADAFLARNASTVVATRWQVEAPAAAAFSVPFYESLHDGADYTAAATWAARRLIEDKKSDWGAARYWAAFEPVARFFETEGNNVQGSQGKRNVNLIDATQVDEVLQTARKQAEQEMSQLKEKEASLNSELAELGRTLTLEERRNSILEAQRSAVDRIEKWIVAALKTARKELDADPQWKPAERLQLTVKVEDESGAGIPGAEVLATEETSSAARTSRFTDIGGIAIFTDLRATTGYKFAVSAKGFASVPAYRENADELNAWLSNAEKTIVMRSSRDAIVVEAKPSSTTKPVQGSKRLKKPNQATLPALTEPFRVELAKLNKIEASNDVRRPQIPNLEAELSEAKGALERATEVGRLFVSQLAEARPKLAEETRELSTIIGNVSLTDVDPKQFEFSGTVRDKNYRGVRAIVTKQTLQPGTSLTITSDESGHFVFAGVKSGIEYVVTVEAEGHEGWRNAPTVLYFPCSIDIRLTAAEEAGQRRRYW